MKIIKKGTLPIEWWFKVVCTCNRCGARYRLESGDDLKYTDDQREGEYVTSKCPTCGYAVTVDKRAPKE